MFIFIKLVIGQRNEQETTNMTLLEVTHLKKTYTGIFSTQAVQALKDINFSV